MKKKVFKIGAILLVFILLFQIYRYNLLNAFAKEGIITFATIYKVNNPGQSSPSLHYYFETEEKEIKGTYGSYLLRYDSLTKLIGKKIPVIYLKSNPSFNNLLVEDDDYERYSKKMPEEMIWIRKYLDD